jgi:hypothetical protein
MPPFVRVVAFLVFTLFFCVPSSTSQNGKKPQAEYDRLTALTRLLATLYPDVSAEQGGVLAMELDFVGGVLYTSNVNISFYPCRQSGVSLEPMDVPYCGQLERRQPVLGMNIGFGAHKDHPIIDVHASGKLVNGALLSVREQLRTRSSVRLIFAMKSIIGLRRTRLMH